MGGFLQQAAKRVIICLKEHNSALSHMRVKKYREKTFQPVLS